MSGDERSAESGDLAARGVGFSTLVTQLSAWADRIVLDHTGLSGRFDWDLQQWSQEPSQRAPTDVLVVARVECPKPD